MINIGLMQIIIHFYILLLLLFQLVYFFLVQVTFF